MGKRHELAVVSLDCKHSLRPQKTLRCESRFVWFRQNEDESFEKKVKVRY